ncbi:MAG: sulfatase-like hydrolase/transferase [Bryobacteraceae bacterium]
MLTRRTAIQSVLAPAMLRGARRPAGEKPNLLFLWTDEQRADTLAAYGNHRFRVPVLNKLAANSIVFDRCYDTQPVCTPARSSVMTGLWPHTTGLLSNNIPLPKSTKTFPELLADSSYRTGYMGKWHLGDEVFAQHGFEEWVSIEDVYDAHFTAEKGTARSSYHHFLASRGYKPDAPESKPVKFSRNFAVRRPIEHCKPAFLATEASHFIEKYRDEPWLLYVNYLEPHMPFYGPLNDLHSDTEAPVPANYPGDNIEREPELYRRSRAKTRENGFDGEDLKSRPGWQRLNRNYAGLCSQVDESVGRILKTLEDSGQADSTIIVFTSDHGEMMGAHSLIGKSVFYEEAIRVPLLMRVPFRQYKPHHVAQAVSHIDLVPTLLELMGRKAPPNLPGESLVPMLSGKPRRDGHVYLEWHTLPKGPNGRTVLSPDGWKMSLFDTDNCLLFHREKDPLEMTNLYYRKESQETISRLRSQIEGWQQRVKDPQRLP